MDTAASAHLPFMETSAFTSVVDFGATEVSFPLILSVPADLSVALRMLSISVYTALNSGSLLMSMGGSRLGEGTGVGKEGAGGRAIGWVWPLLGERVVGGVV